MGAFRAPSGVTISKADSSAAKHVPEPGQYCSPPLVLVLSAAREGCREPACTHGFTETSRKRWETVGTPGDRGMTASEVDNTAQPGWGHPEKGQGWREDREGQERYYQSQQVFNE